MSICSDATKKTPLPLSPNASFIMEQFDDENDLIVAPHALHNKRFTKKYLKNVFPSGFGVQSIRVKDLTNTSDILATTKSAAANSKPKQIRNNNDNTNNTIYNQQLKKNMAPDEESVLSQASGMTSALIPNIAELNQSLATNVKYSNNNKNLEVKYMKGTTGTSAPLQSFTDAFKGSYYMGSANHLGNDINDNLFPGMDDSTINGDAILRKYGEKGAPDDFADVAGAYYTEVLPSGRVPVNVNSRGGDGTGLIDSSIKQVAISAALEVSSPNGEIQEHLLADRLAMQAGTVPMANLLSDELSQGLTTLSVVSKGSQFAAPPGPNKELTTAVHPLHYKMSGFDQLRDYAKRARIPIRRSTNAPLVQPSMLPSLTSSVTLATGAGGPKYKGELHGVPSRAPLGQFTQLSNGKAVPPTSRYKLNGSWEMGASIAGEAASHAGYGPASARIPTATMEKSLDSFGDGLLTIEKGLQGLQEGPGLMRGQSSGYLMSYDQYMNSEGCPVSSDSIIKPIVSNEHVTIDANDNTRSGGGLRIEVKQSRQKPRVGTAPGHEKAGGLGYQTLPDTLHVFVYAFQQVVPASATHEMRQQYDFEMSRDMTFEQILRLIANKSKLLNSDMRFDNDDGNSEELPVIFALIDDGHHNKTWKPITKSLEWQKIKMSCMSFLTKRKSLKIMYSMKFNEDLDEAFLYQNTATLGELRDFEMLGYDSPVQSAGYGLRQVQADGSFAASRRRAKSAPSSDEMNIEGRSPTSRVIREMDGFRSISGEDSIQSDITNSRFKQPRPNSPTVSRSSQKAVSAVSATSGSGIASVSNRRPASPDYSRTQFQITRSVSPSGHLAGSPHGFSDNDLNEMSAGLLGYEQIPPPSLSPQDYPPIKVNEWDDNMSEKTDKSGVVTLNGGSKKELSLMSKYGSPPKPSFGFKHSSRAQSPNGGSPNARIEKLKRNKSGMVMSIKSAKTNTHEYTAAHASDGGGRLLRQSSSLATLLTKKPRGMTSFGPGGLETFSGSTDMSISKVRPTQITKNIMANMEKDKMNRIANELQNRLMLTKW